MFSIGQINASMLTDRGRVRDHNEDFIACQEPTTPEESTKNGWLYILADGVGGTDAGEVASRFATERTLYHFMASEEQADWGERLSQAMQTANAELRQMIAGQSSDSRMATTMVATVLHDDGATMANVGDSRGYHWKQGHLKQVTKDQSLVARLVEEGAITEEEALNHPRKNVILHSLGAENSPQIDLYQVSLAPGEQVVLCSDGLTRHVMDDEIAAIVGEKEPADAAEQLIRLANDRGGEDNISVAVLRIGGQQAKFNSHSAPVVIGQEAQNGNIRHSRALWFYTAVLAIVQVVLIFLIWNIING